MSTKRKNVETGDEARELASVKRSRELIEWLRVFQNTIVAPVIVRFLPYGKIIHFLFCNKAIYKAHHPTALKIARMRLNEDGFAIKGHEHPLQVGAFVEAVHRDEELPMTNMNNGCTFIADGKDAVGLDRYWLSPRSNLMFKATFFKITEKRVRNKFGQHAFKVRKVFMLNNSILVWLTDGTIGMFPEPQPKAGQTYPTKFTFDVKEDYVADDRDSELRYIQIRHAEGHYELGVFIAVDVDMFMADCAELSIICVTMTGEVYYFVGSDFDMKFTWSSKLVGYPRKDFKPSRVFASRRTFVVLNDDSTKLLFCGENVDNRYSFHNAPKANQYVRWYSCEDNRILDIALTNDVIVLCMYDGTLRGGTFRGVNSESSEFIDLTSTCKKKALGRGVFIRNRHTPNTVEYAVCKACMQCSGDNCADVCWRSHIDQCVWNVRSLANHRSLYNVGVLVHSPSKTEGASSRHF